MESTPGSPPPDWQLPPGVNRGLWDYLHDPAIARNYDASLAGSSLLTLDVAFVQRHCPEGARLIDLGCGTGRLLLALAAGPTPRANARGSPGGWRVLGVDLSAPMLQVAAAKARQAGLPVALLQANLTELECLAAGSFDCAACLFSTLGMIRGGGERQRMIGHVHRLLRPGGIFILHVHNRWFNLWNGPGRRWLLQNWLRSWLGRSLALPGQEERGDRLLPAHQGIAGLTLHLFTRGEALGLLRGAGFGIREVRPVSLRQDGRVGCYPLFGWLRAYGYLIAAER